MGIISNTDFAHVFKKYRLCSQISTLIEFGDLLAEEGYIYDNSVFTHWQNGTRTPKLRKVILAMLCFFKTWRH